MTDQTQQTYMLHYVSADGPGDDATWSVYSEQYQHQDDDEPIDGSQKLVVPGLPDEAAARAIANELQGIREPQGEPMTPDVSAAL